ncbi:hypothetical protein [Aestuariivirga litoralis]|nr:hypothetical protein [Aestuariivirga litoralis]
MRAGSGTTEQRPRFRAIPAFAHVVVAIYRNFGAALRMSWPWMLVYAGVQTLALLFQPDVLVVLSGDGPAALRMTSSGWWTVALLMGISMLAFSSLAVNWHRLLLLDEEAEGVERLRLDGLLWRYLGNTALLILTLVPVAVIAMIAGLSISFSVFGSGNGMGSFLLAFGIALLPVAVVLVVLERLMIKLPAIAIGRSDYGFGAAWDDSRGEFLSLAGFVLMVLGTTYGLGLLASVPFTLLSAVLGTHGGLGPLIGSLWQLAINWIGWIIGLNAITTLYGILAEGREV